MQSLRQLLIAILCLLAGAVPVAAAQFIVNNTTDEEDFNSGDGVCETAPGNGVCTLRAAIQEANALPPPHEIILPAGTYTLTIGELDINTDLTINGAGAATTIIEASRPASGNPFNVFTVISVTGVPIPINVGISGVTIRNGFANGAGGGIVNLGTLHLTDVMVTGNHAGDEGGGIRNFGTVTLTRSTVSGNTAGIAGGIFNQNPHVIGLPGEVTITNSTISGNTAGATGGIENEGGVVTITNSTISGNKVTSDLAVLAVGGIANFGQVDMKNTIIAGNLAPRIPDCNNIDAVSNVVIGQINSLGHNLVGDNTGCNFTPATGDQIGTAANPVNPLLGQLADNGGPTPTQSLLQGSPAIDTGDNVGCPPTDQRGVSRPQGAACDIGAFEFIQPVATFATSAGQLSNLSAVPESLLPTAGKPAGLTFPFGFFSWTVTGLTPGQPITLTITYPRSVSPDAQYWKVTGGTWTNVTSLLGTSNTDGDNTLFLTITDGGLGDSDGVANGQISDPGGAGIASAVPFAAFHANVEIEDERHENEVECTHGGSLPGAPSSGQENPTVRSVGSGERNRLPRRGPPRPVGPGSAPRRGSAPRSRGRASFSAPRAWRQCSR